MAFSALITLAAAGTDTGPFDLYSDVDTYGIAFETAVAKSSLLAGFTSTNVPDDTETIRVKSASSLCNNYVDMSFNPSVTYTRAFSTGGPFQGGNSLTCVPSGSNVGIWLNNADYSTFSSNGGLLETGMALYNDGTGTLAAYTRVYDPLATTIYNVSSGVVGSVLSLC
jgi:hypothetical protein